MATEHSNYTEPAPLRVNVGDIGRNWPDRLQQATGASFDPWYTKKQALELKPTQRPNDNERLSDDHLNLAPNTPSEQIPVVEAPVEASAEFMKAYNENIKAYEAAVAKEKMAGNMSSVLPDGFSPWGTCQTQVKDDRLSGIHAKMMVDNLHKNMETRIMGSMRSPLAPGVSIELTEPPKKRDGLHSYTYETPPWDAGMTIKYGVTKPECTPTTQEKHDPMIQPDYKKDDEAEKLDEMRNAATANEREVAENTNDVWVSATMISNIKSNIELLASTIEKLRWEGDEQCSKVDNKTCEEMIRVNRDTLEEFIKMFERFAKETNVDLHATLQNVPDKPVENDIHPAREKSESRAKVKSPLEDIYMKDLGDKRVDWHADNDEPNEFDNPSIDNVRRYVTAHNIHFTKDGVDPVLEGKGVDVDSHLVIDFQTDKIRKLTQEEYAKSVSETSIASSKFNTDFLKTPEQPKPGFSPMATPFCPPPAMPHPMYAQPHHIPVPEEKDHKSGIDNNDLPSGLIDLIMHLPADMWHYEVVDNEETDETEEDRRIILSFTHDTRTVTVELNRLTNIVTVKSKKTARGTYLCQFAWVDPSDLPETKEPSNKAKLLSWMKINIDNLMN